MMILAKHIYSNGRVKACGMREHIIYVARLKNVIQHCSFAKLRLAELVARKPV